MGLDGILLRSLVQLEHLAVLIMAMLNAEDLPDQKRKKERQIQEKKRQNEEALRAELNAKQVEVQKKATAEKKRIEIWKQEVAYDTMTRYISWR